MNEKKMPGFPGWMMFTWVLNMAMLRPSKQVPFFHEGRKKFGNIFAVPTLMGNGVVIGTQTAAKKGFLHIPRSRLFEIFRYMVGPGGIATSLGWVWQRQRTIQKDSLRRERVYKMADTLVKSILVELCSWHGMVDMDKRLRHLLLRNALTTLFGEDITNREREHILKMFDAALPVVTAMGVIEILLEKARLPKGLVVLYPVYLWVLVRRLLYFRFLVNRIVSRYQKEGRSGDLLADILEAHYAEMEVLSTLIPEAENLESGWRNNSITETGVGEKMRDFYSRLKADTGAAEAIALCEKYWGADEKLNLSSAEIAKLLRKFVKALVKRKKVSFPEVKTQVGSHLFAAQDTVHGWLSSCLAAAEQYPEEMKAVDAEITALNGRLPTAADYRQMPHTVAFMSEVAFHEPPTWAVIRQTDEPIELDGYMIPAKTNVYLIPKFIHQTWENGDKFIPYERWLVTNDGVLQLRDPKDMEFFAGFGHGGHRCVGMEFALLEGLLVFVMIRQTLRLEQNPAVQVRRQPGVVSKFVGHQKQVVWRSPLLD
jgi:cytochrome P450